MKKLNKLKKAILLWVYIVLNVIVVFGIICPFFISRSDEMVLIGALIFVANGLHLLFFVIKQTKQLIPQ